MSDSTPDLFDTDRDDEDGGMPSIAVIEVNSPGGLRAALSAMFGGGNVPEPKDIREVIDVEMDVGPSGSGPDGVLLTFSGRNAAAFQTRVWGQVFPDNIVEGEVCMGHSPFRVVHANLRDHTVPDIQIVLNGENKLSVAVDDEGADLLDGLLVTNDR